MQSLTLQQKFFVVLLFGLLSLSLLAPIASNKYLPDSYDLLAHTAAIVQAKKAMDEGQFPIREAPIQTSDIRNPYFQFYSPLPYMIAGKIFTFCRLVGLSNPFVAYKITIWLALLIAGIYMFRLVRWLINSDSIAILSSIVYLTSPYFLININTRGDFTEAFAQGLIPIVLFYTLRTFFGSVNFQMYALTAATWFALITTHLISFVYTSFFIGLFLILLTLRNVSNWKRLINIGLIYSFGCLLACWYLIPIALTANYLNISNDLYNPIHSTWLTPIATLLSTTAISPIPLPGNGSLDHPLYPAIGWMILLAVGVSVYSLFQKELMPNSPYKQMVLPLLIIFLIAFFVTWSPIDFWQFIPKYFVIAQFSYRFLAQTMWIGTLLFAFALLGIFKKLDIRQVLLGVFLITLASSSWLPTNKSSDLTPDYLRQHPDYGAAKSNYLVNKNRISNLISAWNSEIPYVYVLPDIAGKWLKLNDKLIIPAGILSSPHAIFEIKGEIPKNLFKNALELTLIIDGQKKLIKTLTPGQFQWNIPISQLAQLNKNSITLQFLTNKTFTSKQINPKSNDLRQLAVKINSIKMLNLSPKHSILTADTIMNNCSQQKTTKICKIDVPAETNFIQLPVFFYPKLLDIKVNNTSVPYFPISYYHDWVFAGIKLKPGSYTIRIKFVGIEWANWLSGASWLVLLSGLFLTFFRRTSLTKESSSLLEHKC